MGKKCCYDFDNKLFAKLVKQTDATYEDLSEKLDICEASIVQYMSGRVVPTIPALIKISDYFQVPIDVLMKRHTQKEYSEILKGNAEFMFKCRKVAFENYLTRKKNRGVIYEDAFENNEVYYTPYPYNLLECIYGGPIEDVINDDQMAGLEQVLDSLTPREKRSMQLYFEDEKTLKDIGKEFNVTQERIRQIVSKAIRKLRNPVKFKLIQHGIKGQELLRLDKLDADILERKQAINEHIAELKELEKQVEKMEQKPTTKVFIDQIGDLDLSVRSYNCLRRANCMTIDQVIELFENGKIWKVRNLGRKSIDEIICKISSIYNIEFELIADEHGPAYYKCTQNFKEVS